MAHKCINCNSQQVERTGDTFACAKCGYTWDVAHEQANARYLESQGRKPAVSVSEQEEVTSAEDALRVELGSTQPVDVETDDAGGYHLNVRIEGDPNGETELDSDVELDLDHVLLKLEATTIPMLKAMAEEHAVDLTGANRKDDIIEALLLSGKLTVVYAPDGTLIDVE